MRFSRTILWQFVRWSCVMYYLSCGKDISRGIVFNYIPYEYFTLNLKKKNIKMNNNSDTNLNLDQHHLSWWFDKEVDMISIQSFISHDYGDHTYL